MSLMHVDIFADVCGGYNNECADTEGSYVCRCLPGYNGDGVDCSNIDECTDNIFNCTLYDVTNGYGVCNHCVWRKIRSS